MKYKDFYKHLFESFYGTHGWWIGPSGQVIDVPRIGDHNKRAQLYLLKTYKMEEDEYDAGITLLKRKFLHVVKFSVGDTIEINNPYLRGGWDDLTSKQKKVFEDMVLERNFKLYMNGKEVKP